MDRVIRLVVATKWSAKVRRGNRVILLPLLAAGYSGPNPESEVAAILGDRTNSSGG